MLQAENIHSFKTKLSQKHLLTKIFKYTNRDWENPVHSPYSLFMPPKPFPMSPISINLDLTLQCNYRCRHCIDRSIVHKNNTLSYDEISNSLITLQQGGLRSVILIGGGEPTLHPDFIKIVRTIKTLGLQCAIVSNGSMNRHIVQAAPLLQKGDWVRLSLDAGTEQTFHQLHRPAKRLSLQQICAEAGEIKQANPAVQLGFSFVIITSQAVAADQRLIENYREIQAAAKLAKNNLFDYLSLKPFLMRDKDGREIVSRDISDSQDNTLVQQTFIEELNQAKNLQNDRFRIIESANLAYLFQTESNQVCVQPRHCFMQAFRQVLSPLGIFSCPAFRGNSKSFIAPHDSYMSALSFIKTVKLTYKKVLEFDATKECAGITCIYNGTNIWLNELADNPDLVQTVQSQNDNHDMFL